jgi:hypothetical protein
MGGLHQGQPQGAACSLLVYRTPSLYRTDLHRNASVTKCVNGVKFASGASQNVGHCIIFVKQGSKRQGGRSAARHSGLGSFNKCHTTVHSF